MVDPIKNGGPAFPIADTFIWKGDRILSHHSGMDLRDWFASQALTSLANSYHSIDPGHESELARRAYLIADLMLKERKAWETV